MKLKNENTQSIKEKLSQIEQHENIRIIYACESGRRAWDFASPDYDVRFIFVRPVQNYLRAKELPDFIDIRMAMLEEERETLEKQVFSWDKLNKLFLDITGGYNG